MFVVLKDLETTWLFQFFFFKKTKTTLELEKEPFNHDLVSNGFGVPSFFCCSGFHGDVLFGLIFPNTSMGCSQKRSFGSDGFYQLSNEQILVGWVT